MVLWFLNMLQSFARATSEVVTPKEIDLLLIIFMVKFQEYNILKSRTLFVYLFFFLYLIIQISFLLLQFFFFVFWHT